MKEKELLTGFAGQCKTRLGEIELLWWFWASCGSITIERWTAWRHYGKKKFGKRNIWKEKQK